MLSLFGYFVLCVIAMLVSIYGLITLRLGGPEMTPMPWYAWIIGVGILSYLWYWVFAWAPFELVMK